MCFGEQFRRIDFDRVQRYQYVSQEHGRLGIRLGQFFFFQSVFSFSSGNFGRNESNKNKPVRVLLISNSLWDVPHFVHKFKTSNFYLCFLFNRTKLSPIHYLSCKRSADVVCLIKFFTGPKQSGCECVSKAFPRWRTRDTFSGGAAEKWQLAALLASHDV